LDEKSVNRYHTLNARAKLSLVQRFADRERQRQRVTPELLSCGGAMATLHLFAIFSALTTTLLCIPTSSCSCLNTVAASSTGQCLVASGTSDIYSKVTEPTLAPSHLQGMQLSLLNDQLPENAAGFLLLLDFLSQLPFLLQL
jgi:hypothetical protein